MQDAVVDTNVLVRAFLKPESSDGEIIKRVVICELNLLISNGQLEELGRVLEYPRFKKFNVTLDATEIFIKTIVTFGKIVFPQTTNLCRDNSDNIILGTALAMVGNKGIYLISADKDLLVLKSKVEGVVIVTPQEFLIYYARKRI